MTSSFFQQQYEKISPKCCSNRPCTISNAQSLDTTISPPILFICFCQIGEPRSQPCNTAFFLSFSENYMLLSSNKSLILHQRMFNDKCFLTLTLDATLFEEQPLEHMVIVIQQARVNTFQFQGLLVGCINFNLLSYRVMIFQVQNKKNSLIQSNRESLLPGIQVFLTFLRILHAMFLDVFHFMLFALNSSSYAVCYVEITYM